MIRLRPSGADEVLIKRVRDWYEPGPGVFIEPQPLFSPAMLFTGTTAGVWYDPSDTTTLFQNAAGTLPVTAVEQPVGLMLDKSKGLVLGPELVANGDFSNGATGWTLGDGWSIVGGQAVRSPSTFGSVLSQPISVTAGKTYKVTYTISAYAAQSVQVIFDGGTQALGVIRSSVGTFTEYLTARTGNTTLWMTTGSSATSLTIDNISVRELPGNHAFNPTTVGTANFPVLSCRYNILNNTDVLATQSVSTRAAKYILSFYGTGSVAMSGTYTGTLVGTGVDNRVYVEFTATAGTLTLTVTGSVTKAQLEEL